MRYRTLGKTGFQISEISLGTVQLGLPYGIPNAFGKLPMLSELEALEIIRRALVEGVNFFDTARGYGDSEAIIGRVLKKCRKEVFIATKLEALSDEMTHDEIAKSMRASIEASRKALGRETLDLLQVHNATESLLDREVILDILDTARNKEWIRFQGVSTYGRKAPEKAIIQGHWDTVQVEFNVFNQRNREVFQLAKARQVGVIVRSAMLKGAMTTPTDEMPDLLKQIAKKAQQLPDYFECKTLSVPQVALLYVLSFDEVSSVLSGVLSLGQLLENIQAVEAPRFTLEQLEAAKAYQLEDEKLTDPRHWGF